MDDCVAIARRAIDAGVADANKIVVVGGSHGGFLGAHLVGQRPEMFKAAVLRNPVTDVASMVSLTDIPDWCFVETLGKDVERRRGRGLKARCGRRDAPGKVLKDRRSPRERGRMGTSV